jgi:hypothetical protein
MQSSSKIQLERKFLLTETPFSSPPRSAPAETRRFAKVFVLYQSNHSISEGGIHTFEWCITSASELKKTAQKYYVEYNIKTR